MKATTSMNYIGIELTVRSGTALRASLRLVCLPAPSGAALRAACGRLSRSARFAPLGSREVLRVERALRQAQDFRLDEAGERALEAWIATNDRAGFAGDAAK